jgi:hypothetical protein
MKLRQFLLLGLGAAAVSLAACSNDAKEPIVTPGPQAYIRYVNAVTDTVPLDFSIIDNPLENLPTLKAKPYGSGSGAYQSITPGARHVRVFVNDSNPAITKQTVFDQTLTFAEGVHYTLLHVGSARAKTAQLLLLTDNLPTVGAGSIAVRVINATTGSVDAYIGNSGTTPVTAPVVPALTNIASKAATSWVTLPARPQTAGSLYSFAITNVGSATPMFTDTPNQPGASATGSVSAQGGVQLGGSVLTAIILPGATVGSKAASSSNTNPSVLMIIDRSPTS